MQQYFRARVHPPTLLLRDFRVRYSLVMSRSDKYRDRAAAAISDARKLRDARAKTELLDLAQHWAKLATIAKQDDSLTVEDRKAKDRRGGRSRT
jgi:hypothetical protein